MVFGLRRKEQKPPTLFDIDGGILKEDWARTGNIDFYVVALESASPQTLVLRVEEKKIVENVQRGGFLFV